jgi:pimeloyl-ACP methyl ester carboxylesterase
MPLENHKTTHTTEPKWSGNLDRVSFVFYPGRSSTQTQASKYIGNQTLITSTGEIAYYPPNNILTMPREALWVYPSLTEIDITPTYALNPILPFKRWWQGIKIQTGPKDYTPLYPTDEAGSFRHYTIDHAACSLGQATDIADHALKIEHLKKTIPDIQDIILYGVSRGAATTFSALATHQYEDVKLCVLEGVPSSMSGIFKSYAKHRDIGKLAYQYLGPTFLGGQHKTDKASQARAYVKNFPNEVPLLIVSSIEDEVVPHENSIRLALRVAAKRVKARDEGKTVAPVYFLQLDTVGHNHYTTHDSEDALRYQSCIHAIYKQLKLPYIETYAEQDHSILDVSELTNGKLSEQVRFQMWYWEDKDNRSLIREEALNALKHSLAAPDITDKTRTRMRNIANAMPLYTKNHTSRFSFWQTPAQKALASPPLQNQPLRLR